MESDELQQAKDLLYSVLLFHSGGPWSKEKQDLWDAYIGEGKEVTTRALCDKIRLTLGLLEDGEE